MKKKKNKATYIYNIKYFCKKFKKEMTIPDYLINKLCLDCCRKMHQEVMR